MPVEAVIWDFGGVLTSSPFDAFNRFERERGLPLDFIRSVNARALHDNAWARFERAEIDAEAFDAAFARESSELGHEVRGAEVIALLSGDVRPRMVAALRACRARVKTGCITNNVPHAHGPGMSSDAVKAAQVAAIFELFDAVIESSRAGLRKPDPRIYAMICERLGVRPEACVYLDDLGINCKPAAALGMTAIKVRSEAQALDELRRILRWPELEEI